MLGFRSETPLTQDIWHSLETAVVVTHDEKKVMPEPIYHSKSCAFPLPSFRYTLTRRFRHCVLVR